jgi:hypothetical protein
MRKLIAAAMTLTATGTATAQAIHVAGLGNLSCGESIEIMRGDSTVQQRQVVGWMQGFITGRNFEYANTPSVKQVTLKGEPADAKLWIEHYCTRNPTRSLFEATLSYIETMGGASTTLPKKK